MSRIMFTWELGGGSGHISPYLDLISKLEADGHEIFYAVKQLEKVYSLMQGKQVTWFQAPTVLIHGRHQVKPVHSYAHIIHNAGFNDPYQLAGMIKAWQNLYRLVEPDLLLFDYSPTAMLAARGSGIKTIACGTGFHLPPDSVPLTGFPGQHGKGQSPDELMSFEKKLLGIINQALDICDIPKIANLYELIQADRRVLRTLPEMDHYPGRNQANYAGIFRSPDAESPEWPSIPGPKIFAYLKPFNTLTDLLDTLTERRFPTLVHYDGISADIIEKYHSDTLKFCRKPLDMRAIGATADLAICNASHGTTAELLLQGMPLLLLPLHTEQQLVAQNAEKLGAALAAPALNPKGMSLKLRALLKDSKYREAAVKFAEQYDETSAHRVEQDILLHIDALL